MVQNMCLIHVSGKHGESLVLSIHGRTDPTSNDYWDANWLTCTAVLRTSSFGEMLCRSVRNEDLGRFKRMLTVFLTTEGSEALLDTLDGWLDVRVCRDDEGNAIARCQLVDDPVNGNPIEVDFQLDDHAPATLVTELETVLAQYPIVGQSKVT